MSPSDTAGELGGIRNIGVIAHIDAGKTTTTERFLYYSGKTHRVGDVDDGNTVMDYLQEERERGITIVAAAASFEWGPEGAKKLIHLIDTPGHIDFTAEVERSIRVTDGAVVIFSGVEGVEAQSEKVWRQSDAHFVPKIAFVNKLDRMGASFPRVVAEISGKFKDIKAVPFQIPLGIESGFDGVVDLVTMRALRFRGDDGASVVSEDIPPAALDEAKKARDEMLSALGELSDPVMELYLSGADIPPEILTAEARKAVLARKLCPVFAGSAKRNIGIQPLLDAVALYLPSPADRGAVPAHKPGSGEEIMISPDAKSFCGLVFKVVAGSAADLYYTRTYSGRLNVNDTVLNARTGERVRIKRILRLFAKNAEPMDSVGPGDIVGLTGPQDLRTGDTLCSVNTPALLEKITFPEPVISIAVEPKSTRDKERLEHCLSVLCREDPTLSLSKHESTGQSILSGMGELHLEINTHRVRDEFKLEARFGAPRVTYRETLKEPRETSSVFSKTIGDTELYAEVDFILTPAPGLERGIETRLELRDKRSVPRQWADAALEAMSGGLKTGGNLGYQLIYINAVITDIRGNQEKTTPAAVTGAVLEGIRQAIVSNTVMLEPVMRLDITSPEDTIGEISGALSARGAVILGVTAVAAGVKRLRCESPLAEMFGLSKALPKLSGGRASLSMEPCGFRELSPAALKNMSAL
jgi:elongation factor G